MFYYGLPQVMSFLTSIDGVTAAIMGLTLHFSAYMAETIRAAILGVDRSQWEAAQSEARHRGPRLPNFASRLDSDQTCKTGHGPILLGSDATRSQITVFEVTVIYVLQE